MKARLNETLCRMIVLFLVLPVLIIISIFTPKDEPTEADFDL